ASRVNAPFFPDRIFALPARTGMEQSTKSRCSRGRVLARRTVGGDPVHGKFFVEKVYAVNVLAAWFRILVCHINQPPFKTVGTTDHIRLTGREQDIVCLGALHIKKRYIQKRRSGPCLAFYGQQILPVL